MLNNFFFFNFNSIWYWMLNCQYKNQNFFVRLLIFYPKAKNKIRCYKIYEIIKATLYNIKRCKI